MTWFFERKCNGIIFILVLFFFFLTSTGSYTRASSKKTVVVFFNEACHDCSVLVNKTYPKLFSEYGYELVKRDYIN